MLALAYIVVGFIGGVSVGYSLAIMIRHYDEKRRERLETGQEEGYFVN